MRVNGVIAIAGGAAAGYLAGRRHGEIQSRLRRLTASRRDLPAPPSRRATYDTEFDHVGEREQEHRHAAAEGIRSHPLRAHERRQRDDAETWATRPLTRDTLDEQRVAPRPY